MTRGFNMNMVDFAIDNVVNGVNDISPYLLEIAFDNPNKGYGHSWGPINTEFSIEQGIREKVILKMVAPLLNVAGGETSTIDLSSAQVQNLEGGIVHVNVPDFLTGGRRILSVIEVYPGNLNSMISNGYNLVAGPQCGGGGSMGSAVNRMISALDDSNVQRTFTSFTMVGNNSFLIRDAGSALFNMLAKVILSYDEHFSIIPPKMYDQFAYLCVLATKAYIYRNCRRGMQEAVAKFGVSVNELQDDIQGYADAHNEFRMFFEDEIKKYLAYADPKGVADQIRMLVPRKR
ncbi:hypothetical protein PQC07_gp004 [Aeromonas phage D3]|nr:hypothetical protein PQC07_gp004 [Aeromonas phage D3]YP_010668752.1 hypothetical protein PQC08_gp004 [Aeromonas phage D6]QDJ97177.2 hypothetical protein D6_0004 [Aeromonas phage D6]QLM02889.1 hypothetical protein D3_0004 [Aeromonas phage D3]